MWGRKEEPAPPAEPESPKERGSAAPSASTPAPAAARSPQPARVAPDRGAALGQAQIGKSLKVKGEITGSEDLIIDGEVEGTVELRDNNLTVGANGKVHAHVKARSITVLGRLEGNVQAGERVEICKTGALEGDLVTPRIVIEDGAVFRGSIDILKQGSAPSPLADKKPEGQAAKDKKPNAAGVMSSGAAAAKADAAPSSKAD